MSGGRSWVPDSRRDRAPAPRSAPRRGQLLAWIAEELPDLWWFAELLLAITCEPSIAALPAGRPAFLKNDRERASDTHRCRAPLRPGGRRRRPAARVPGEPCRGTCSLAAPPHPAPDRRAAARPRCRPRAVREVHRSGQGLREVDPRQPRSLRRRSRPAPTGPRRARRPDQPQAQVPPSARPSEGVIRRPRAWGFREGPLLEPLRSRESPRREVPLATGEQKPDPSGRASASARKRQPGGRSAYGELRVARAFRRETRFRAPAVIAHAAPWLASCWSRIASAVPGPRRGKDTSTARWPGAVTWTGVSCP